jgi:hypothetical protein
MEGPHTSVTSKGQGMTWKDLIDQNTMGLAIESRHTAGAVDEIGAKSSTCFPSTASLSPLWAGKTPPPPEARRH